MKNIFEETYKGIQEAKKAYNAASDKEGQEAARAIYRKATESLDGLSKMEMKIWNYYEAAKDCGNEYIDINDIIYDSEVENLVACIRVIADVHGMKCKQAHRFINNIINVIRVTFQLIIIHGYKGSGSFPSEKILI